MRVVCAWPFSATAFRWRVAPEKPALTVAVRACFAVGPDCAVAALDPDAVGAGEALSRAIARTPWKPRAEIVVVGHARAAGGSGPGRAGFRLGALAKEVAFTRGAAPSPACALGLACRPFCAVMAELEDGPLRAFAADLLDEARVALAPPGLDYGLFCAAPPDQQAEALDLSSPLALRGLHPALEEAEIRLPRLRPLLTVSQDPGRPLEVNPDTLVVDADTGIVTITWRAIVPVSPSPLGLMDPWVGVAIAPGSELPPRAARAVPPAGPGTLLTPAQPKARTMPFSAVSPGSPPRAATLPLDALARGSSTLPFARPGNARPIDRGPAALPAWPAPASPPPEPPPVLAAPPPAPPPLVRPLPNAPPFPAPRGAPEAAPLAALPAASATRADEAASLPPAPAPEEAPAELEVEAYAVLCARRADGTRTPAELLREAGLSERQWQELSAREEARISSERDRAARFDDAYVATHARLAAVDLPDFARLSSRIEREGPSAVAAELDVPLKDVMRLQRVWTRRAASTPALAAELFALRRADAPSGKAGG